MNESIRKVAATRQPRLSAAPDLSFPEETSLLYDAIASRYDEIFPLENAKVEAIVSLVNKPRPAILDVGCATGALALELAARGATVRGIDLGGAMIQIANERQRQRRSSAVFEVRNMLDLPAESRYDAVLCLGNTLPHLASREDVETFLGAAARTLDGGVLLLQIVNFDKVLREGRIAFDTVQGSDFRFTRRYAEIGPNRILFETELLDKTTGRLLTDQTALRPIRKADLLESLRSASFSVECFSDFRGTPSTDDDFATLYMARKQRS